MVQALNFKGSPLLTIKSHDAGAIPERLEPVGTNYFRRLFKDSLILNDLVLRTIRLHT